MQQKLQKIIEQNPSNEDLLIELVKLVRPGLLNSNKKAAKNFDELLYCLNQSDEIRIKVREAIESLLCEKDLNALLSESGVYTNLGFFSSFFKKIAHFFLPPVYEPSDIRGVFNAAFPSKNDYKWFANISQDKLIEFIKLVFNNKEKQINDEVKHSLLHTIDILSHRIVGISIDTTLVQRNKQLSKSASPFLRLQRELMTLMINEKGILDREEYSARVNQIINDCLRVILDLRKQQHQKGAGLSLTFILQRLHQHINRLRVLLNIVLPTDEKIINKTLASFFNQILKSENLKYSLSNHIGSNLEILAFQITEHTVKTGEHYIAESPEEYSKMKYSAMGGGAIVGLLSAFKTGIYNLKLAPFGEAFLYSMNYSLGFIGIHLTHSTLATKQPAMTASKIAASLDIGKEEGGSGIQRLSDLIVRVFRTQFIAFMGNVIIAFPIAFLIGWGYAQVFDHNIAGEAKAWKLINEIHPWQSLSILYAGFTGVFLFLSGVISGYYDNAVIFHRVPERIKKHKFLSFILPKSWMDKFCNYIANNTGSIIGNFTLGIFLGTAAMIGHFFGLPFDIRHITFASGNFGLALSTLGTEVQWQTIGVSVIGIFCIGLLNFIVSFGLAILLAIKSRKVAFNKTALLLIFVVKKFFKNPKSFFIP